MDEFPETRSSLLLQIRADQHQDAWARFVTLYRPVIYRLARQRGLQDSDAQDLAQRVLMAIAGSIDRWQKEDESVRFRHWVRKIVRNAIINALSRRPPDVGDGSASSEELLANVA
ncbi:MAG: sigma-70 family RNA polymerase sigma factor, partial [Planctomycetota bacterium]